MSTFVDVFSLLFTCMCACLLHNAHVWRDISVTGLTNSAHGWHFSNQSTGCFFVLWVCLCVQLHCLSVQAWLVWNLLTGCSFMKVRFGVFGQ